MPINSTPPQLGKWTLVSPTNGEYDELYVLSPDEPAIAVFDRDPLTGTLTFGKPEIIAVLSSDMYEEDDVLRVAAALESQSEHLREEKAQRRPRRDRRGVSGVAWQQPVSPKCFASLGQTTAEACAS